MAEHIQTDVKRYKCDSCGASFPRISHLNRHQRIHTGERPWECQLCGSSFSQMAHLNRHQLVHTGEKPWECELCGTGFSLRSSLKMHKRIHSGERPFKCELCESTFSYISSLKCHMQSHTREKPFTCELCDAAYSHKPNLTQHMRVHSKKTNCVCILCNLHFSETILKRHKQKQSIKVPVKCRICDRAFARMDTLRQHIIRVHADRKLLMCPGQQRREEIRAKNKLLRRKTKDKLIVDEVKEISAEKMKSQLFDTTDIVTTHYKTPQTKRLMHWKAYGGVEKLFARPGRPTPSRVLSKLYRRHLTTRVEEDEDFDMATGGDI